MDKNGTWVAAWDSWDPDIPGDVGRSEIVFARSLDDGATWSFPRYLGTSAANSLRINLSPTLHADDDGNWIMAWKSYEPGITQGTAHGNFLYSRSTDGGYSWSTPLSLNDDLIYDSTVLSYRPVDLAGDNRGNLIATWEHHPIAGDRDILYIHSPDNGITWSSPRTLNTNADTDSGDDINPCVVNIGGQNWLAVWGSNEDNISGKPIGDDYDILVSRSSDGGMTWSPAQPLDNDAGNDSEDNMGARIASNQTGEIIVGWNVRGMRFGSENRGEVAFSLSSDKGATWSHPAPMNSSALSDIIVDGFDDIATDGAGRWIIVVSSEDFDQPGIGLDGDIVFYTLGEPGAGGRQDKRTAVPFWIWNGFR